MNQHRPYIKEKDKSSHELELAKVIIDSSPAILFRRLAADNPEQRKMVYVSSNISRFGYRAEDFLNGSIMFRDIVYPGDTKRTLKEIKNFVKENVETYTQFYRIVTKRGEIRWVEDRTSIFVDNETQTHYHQGIVIDIHDRKVAEDKLRVSEEKYRQIVETTGEGFLLMDKSLKITDLNSAYMRMTGRSRSELIGQAPFDKYSNEFLQLQASDQNPPACNRHLEVECEIEAKDKQTVPVLVQANALCSDTGEIIGNMAFVTDLSSQKQALFLAGDVQQSLLPENPPAVKGLDIAGRNIPCDEVGGDYFDYIWNNDTTGSKFDIVIGDISGHGVASALLMSSARAFLRMRASQTVDIVDIMTDMNQHMTKDVFDTGRFMTLFYLSIDENRSHVEWVRAGHDPAIFYDSDQDKFEELKGPGLALGVDEDFAYRQQRKNGIKTGQLIVLGTDGIWEATNGRGEMFGKNRLKELIRQHASYNSETILTAVFQAHDDFTKGMKPEDDITMVIVKFV